MGELAEEIRACNQCRYWVPNLRGESAREGVCRKLIENPNYYGSLVTEARDTCADWARTGVYEDMDGKAQEDRRVALRNRINLPAHLQTASGTLSVWLADISEAGAGVSVPNPPAAGTPTILKWSCYEVFGRIAWTNRDSCGVTFDAAISSEVVYEAMREGALKNDRSAERSRIAPGRKRTGLVRH